MARAGFVFRFLKLCAVVVFTTSLAACGGGGDGSASTWFGEPIVATLDSPPRSLAFGDFDGDGRPDAVFSLADGIVYAMRGQGDGTFHPPQATAAVKNLSRIAIGDVDGDRVSDLALTQGCVGPCQADVPSLYVMLGKGDGTFGAPRVYEIPEQSSGVLSVVIGDLNGDGYGDVTVGTPNTAILIYLAEGDGSLRAPMQLRTLPVTMDVPVLAVAVADVDGDRRADLIAFDGGPYYSGVSTFLGFGDATFGTARFQGAGVSPSQAAVVDFDCDGRADLAFNGNRTGMQPGPGNLTVYLGNGDGTFRVGADPPYPWAYSTATFAAGDLDRDGLPDLVVRSSGSSELSILLGRGDGTFAQPIGELLTLNDAGVWALIDLDGDGRLDLVLVTANGFAVLRAAR